MTRDWSIYTIEIDGVGMGLGVLSSLGVSIGLERRRRGAEADVLDA